MKEIWKELEKKKNWIKRIEEIVLNKIGEQMNLPNLRNVEKAGKFLMESVEELGWNKVNKRNVQIQEVTRGVEWKTMDEDK